MYKDVKDRNTYQLNYYHNNEGVKEAQKKRKIYYYWRNKLAMLGGYSKKEVDDMNLTTEIFKKECKKLKKGEIV